MRDNVDAAKEAKELDKLKKYIASTFPNLIAEPAIKERCMYTVGRNSNILEPHVTI